jgi:hypothetical protein
MATKEQIVAAILEVAGNPESGPIPALAVKWADAIVGLDIATPEVASERPAKETRITKPEETR